ncbi:MAG: radical SAM protein, partial [Candidatus Poribacteria bacterium]
LWGRVMNANFASIMPQIIAVWCEEQGHDVVLVPYTGFEELTDELPDDIDILFVSAFTQAAQLSYALSSYFQKRGTVTVLGGPHARCYPEDARKYFDYVLGFTDKDTIHGVLTECAQHRPEGVLLSALTQPAALPGLRERWKFAEMTLRKAPLIKLVPMIGSLGCPYTCSFCIDSVIPYQPLDFDVMTEDLRFLLTQYKRPRVGWHDPNFGVRFDDYMDAIEAAVPPDRIDFVAESTLSLLSEDHLKRLKANGFKGILPGIESWYDMGNKSKTGSAKGIDKVRRVAEHVKLVAEYIPYIQTNIVFGIDADEGPDPFELTKKFLSMAPMAFPAFSLLTAFGRAAPLNLQYQRDNRVLPFPFHFLNNNHAMNVKPKNYEWPEFYDHVIDVTKSAYSWPAITKRFGATPGWIPKAMNFIRATSSEGFGRITYYTEVRRLLVEDRKFRAYFEGETTDLPPSFLDRLRADLGPFWDWLPEGAIHHDPNAYLTAEDEASLIQVEIPTMADAAAG